MTAITRIADVLDKHLYGGPTLCSCGQAFAEVENERGEVVWQSWSIHAAAAIEAQARPAVASEGLRAALLSLWKAAGYDGSGSAMGLTTKRRHEIAALLASDAGGVGALDVEPCVYCGGRRWTDDENWSPDDPATWKGERSHGSGLIPCGSCNEGGWDVSDYGPALGSGYRGLMAARKDAERQGAGFYDDPSLPGNER